MSVCTEKEELQGPTSLRPLRAGPCSRADRDRLVLVAAMVPTGLSKACWLAVQFNVGDEDDTRGKEKVWGKGPSGSSPTAHGWQALGLGWVGLQGTPCSMIPLILS